MKYFFSEKLQFYSGLRIRVYPRVNNALPHFCRSMYCHWQQIKRTIRQQQIDLRNVAISNIWKWVVLDDWQTCRKWTNAFDAQCSVCACCQCKNKRLTNVDVLLQIFADAMGSLSSAVSKRDGLWNWRIVKKARFLTKIYQFLTKTILRHISIYTVVH